MYSVRSGGCAERLNDDVFSPKPCLSALSAAKTCLSAPKLCLSITELELVFTKTVRVLLRNVLHHGTFFPFLSQTGAKIIANFAFFHKTPCATTNSSFSTFCVDIHKGAPPHRLLRPIKARLLVASTVPGGTPASFSSLRSKLTTRTETSHVFSIPSH